MKATFTYFLVLFLLALAGCQGEATNPNANEHGDVVVKNYGNDYREDWFNRTFEGKLGDRMTIQMDLRREGEHIFGSYQDLKQKVSLQLDGEVYANDSVRMKELSGKNIHTGWFLGKLEGKDAFSGIWTDLDQEREMAFSLQAQEQ